MVPLMTSQPGRTPTAVPIVSGAIFLGIALGGWLSLGAHFRSLPMGASTYLVHVIGLAIAFLLPAQWVREPTDVVARWRRVLPAILVGTVVWDALMTWVAPRHHFLDGWWLVYPSSLVFFALLLALHGVLVAWIAALQARARH